MLLFYLHLSFISLCFIFIYLLIYSSLLSAFIFRFRCFVYLFYLYLTLISICSLFLFYFHLSLISLCSLFLFYFHLSLISICFMFLFFLFLLLSFISVSSHLFDSYSRFLPPQRGGSARVGGASGGPSLCGVR